MWDELVARSRKWCENQSVLILGGGISPENEGYDHLPLELKGALTDRVDSVAIYMVRSPKLSDVDLDGVSVVLNTSYGLFGEDGTARGFFDATGMPSSGSSVLSSAIGMDKDIYLKLVKSFGLSAPAGEMASMTEKMQKAFRNVPHGTRVLLKAVDGGNSVGIQLKESVSDALISVENMSVTEAENTRVEEFIEGKIGTAAGFVYQDNFYFGDAVEIVKSPDSDYYDLSEKKKGTTIKKFSKDVTSKLKNECEIIYRRLKCDGIVRFDFMERYSDIFHIEINTIPGLYSKGNLFSCFERRMTFPDLVCLVCFLANDAFSRRMEYLSAQS